MKYFLAILAFISSSFIFLTKQVNPATPLPSETLAATSSPFTPPPKPTISPTNLPTAQPNSKIDDYIYPGSQVVSQSSNSLTLKSSDNPNTILNWYSQKFSHGFSSNNVANNNVNGNVNASINASSSTQSINIVIKKIAGELYTTIEIGIKSL